MKEALFVIFAFVFLLAVFMKFDYFQPKRESPEKNTLTIGTNDIKTEFARTEEERNRGLSGRTNLERGTGLLFIFNEPGVYGFWMKNMNFSIDIIWIDKERSVISCEENIKPESYPKVFYPPEESQFVLEVPSSFCRIYGVLAGEKVVWTN